MVEKLKSAKEYPFVSVIIPVYNDAKNLTYCLGALENQTYPENCYEVIVVDNDSDQKIDYLINQYPHSSLIEQKRPGSYAARNKGISIAKGEIIAFTDSDCIPFSDWIEKGVKDLLSSPNCGLLSGRIDLYFKSKNKMSAVEVYEKVNAFQQKNRIEMYNFGVTANLFTFKTVIDDVGHFKPNLKSGGDLEWGNRVYLLGYKQIYSENTCVLHPARNSFRQIFKKTKRVVGGLYDLNETKKYMINHIIKDLKKLLGSTLGLAKRFVLGLPPSEKFTSPKQKLQYLIVSFFIGSIKIYEKLRLSRGGLTKRS
jgi:glycosyltransferase involved in cell wall biosynthesis